MVKRKRVSKRSSRKRPRRSFKRRGPGLKRVVKTLIRRSQETKHFQFYDSNNAIYVSSHASYAGSVIPLTPYNGYLAIQQGTGQGGRIGNVINMTRLNFQFILNPNPYAVGTNGVPQPRDIILWIFSDKLNPTSLPVQGADFLQLGNTSQGLTNTITDEMAPWNSDAYLVHKRIRYKLGYSEYTAGTGAAANSGFYANNDYKISVKRSINILKYAVKRVKYNDNSSTPTTRGVYAIFQAVANDGQQIANTGIPAAYGFILDCKYKDA